MNKSLLGKVIAWIAILAAVVGFFWQATIMAGVAIVLGIVGFFMKANVNKMSLTATIMGLVAILIGMIHY